MLPIVRFWARCSTLSILVKNSISVICLLLTTHVWTVLCLLIDSSKCLDISHPLRVEESSSPFMNSLVRFCAKTTSLRYKTIIRASIWYWNDQGEEVPFHIRWSSHISKLIMFLIGKLLQGSAPSTHTIFHTNAHLESTFRLLHVSFSSHMMFYKTRAAKPITRNRTWTLVSWMTSTLLKTLCSDTNIFVRC